MSFKDSYLGAPYTMGLDKWPPINQCIENEQPWTISTDFNPNCRILSLPSIASICVQRLGVNPLATLCAATRNAATSVVHRTEKPHGMIKEGYVANINILNGEKWQRLVFTTRFITFQSYYTGRQYCNT